MQLEEIESPSKMNILQMVSTEILNSYWVLNAKGPNAN